MMFYRSILTHKVDNRTYTIWKTSNGIVVLWDQTK